MLLWSGKSAGQSSVSAEHKTTPKISWLPSFHDDFTFSRALEAGDVLENYLGCW